MASLLAHRHRLRVNGAENGAAKHLLEIARLGLRGLGFIHNTGTPVRLTMSLMIGHALTFLRRCERSDWGLRLQLYVNLGSCT